jgi:hypothetical protein
MNKGERSRVVLSDLLEDSRVWSRLTKGAPSSLPSARKLAPSLARRARHMDLVIAFGGQTSAINELYPRKKKKTS